MAVYSQFEAVTLVTERLDEARAFYRDVFEAALVYEDAVCAMFQVGPVVVNLLAREAAVLLVRPLAPGRDDGQVRSVFTLRVDDADAACAALAGKGVTILDGPADRPWGRRTATFADPAGQMWELAQVLDRESS